MLVLNGIQYMNAVQAAAVLGLSPDSVRRYCNQQPQKIAAVKFGRDWMVPVGEVDRFSLCRGDIGRPSATPRTELPKFVYLVRSSDGLVKIGHSINPEARTKQLGCNELIHFFQCDGLRTEKRLHKIFSPVRVRGEWFNLQSRHIDWIQFLLKP